MLERIDAVLSSKMTTVITGAMLLAVVFHTTFDVLFFFVFIGYDSWRISPIVDGDVVYNLYKVWYN